MPRSARTFVMAAVSVVFPWSTCPIVPMLRCGLSRTYACLVMTDLLLVRCSYPLTRALTATARCATLPRRVREANGGGSASRAVGGRHGRRQRRRRQRCQGSRQRRAAERAGDEDGEPEHDSKRAAPAAKPATGLTPTLPCSPARPRIFFCGDGYDAPGR